MQRLLFDLECDGLLREVTRIWCLAILDLDTKVVDTYIGHDEVRVAVARLQGADQLVGHNILFFDLPVITKVLGIAIDRYDAAGTFRIIDTLILSRLLCPERKAHSLKAWGETLGCPKGEFHDFSQFSPAMPPYMVQDCHVNAGVHDEIMPRAIKYAAAAELENQIADVTAEQIRNGFCLDVPAATALVGEFRSEFAATRSTVLDLFPPQVLHKTAAGWEGSGGGLPMYLTPKASSTKTGLTKGAVYAPIKFKPFNPTSRAQIGALFVERFKWTPRKKTPTGKPVINAEVLRDMPWPEAQHFAQLFDLQKKVAMMDGRNGWLRYADAEGRVYGEVVTIGTQTHRMAHKSPNIGQVNKKDTRMRRVWIAGPRKVLVGGDVKQLEIAMLGNLTAAYDGGKLCRIIETTDPFAVGAGMVGLVSSDSRKIMKRFCYAMIYGAFDKMLGSIIRLDAPSPLSNSQLGAMARARLEAGFTGLHEVTQDAIAEAASGFITAIDGRKIKVRQVYSALNFKLQSSGAIVVKKAMVIWRQWIAERGWDSQAQLVAQIHDEAQIECDPEIAEEVGKLLVAAFTAAGQFYRLNLTLTGSWQVGHSWADTH